MPAVRFMEDSAWTVRWQSWLNLLDKAAQKPNKARPPPAGRLT
jgi:hypothetical protein